MRAFATIADASWLHDTGLQKLLAALSADGEQAWVAGGAVRNALLGQPVTDIDIATTTVPDETVRRAQAAGFKTVPTGYEHGTITVVVKGRGHEVTTLRADVETDGRRAKVRFGKDWAQDAARRDFTINALYAEADGTVIDLVGGLADLESRTLRFIGDPEDRIREDYLRILRFFRFFAWYGEGRPDAAGLKACARLKDGVATLSAERVWVELKKLLAAPDPARALLWMRQTGVLTLVLPETEKWGIDSVHGLVAAEQALGWKPDPLLRLEAIVPPDEPRMVALSQRLKFSRAEAERLRQWASAIVPQAQTSDRDFAKFLYRAEGKAVEDRLRLALASARSRAVSDAEALSQAAGYSRLLDILAKWEKPRFPLGGDDLTALGAKPGKKLGEILGKLEAEWVDSGFATTRDALLERAAQMIGK